MESLSDINFVFSLVIQQKRQLTSNMNTVEDAKSVVNVVEKKNN